MRVRLPGPRSGKVETEVGQLARIVRDDMLPSSKLNMAAFDELLGTTSDAIATALPFDAALSSVFAERPKYRATMVQSWSNSSLQYVAILAGHSEVEQLTVPSKVLNI